MTIEFPPIEAYESAFEPAEPMPAAPQRMFQDSATFTADFTPPDYLVDGIIQRRFIYSMTAPTGSGKTAILLLLAAHAALGRPLAGRDIPKSRVAYLAGENPDDVRMRWIAMAEKLEFDLAAIDVHFIPGTFSLTAMEKQIAKEAKAAGGFHLVIVDTSAAFFEGKDENSNTELGKHARILRRFTTLPGEPTVIVAAHPTKNATNEGLLPRGGGAFLAEVDGNLVIKKSDSVVDLSWQGKFRGADFEPIGFKLETVTTDSLKDSRGRKIPTVMASPIAASERAAMADTAMRNEDQVLILLADGAQSSIAAIAEALGWISFRGEPQKSRAKRALDNLKAARMVETIRGRWQLTDKGRKEAQRVENGADA